MSIGIRIQNTMGYCKFVAGCVGGAGLAVAYQMEAIGLALTAIGGIGCLWAIASSRNTSGERDLNSGRIVSNNREQIAAQASGLMIPDMDDRTRNAIIETVARIPVNERGQVIGLVSRYPQMCNTTNILQIISDIARIPANEREQVTHLVSRLIRPHMLSMSISAIFTEAASIPVNGREQVTHLVSRLIHPQMHGIGISFIIRSVASIPANEREQVINLVSRLIHPQMDSLQICLIIGTVASIPANERVQFINLASRLFTQDRANFGITIATFARIPANERVQFINLVSPLIHPQMPSIATYSIIESVASIPVNEREQAITLAFRLINQETDALDRSRIIANAISEVPASNRTQALYKNLALEQNVNIYHQIPASVLDYEMCKIAVTKSGYWLQYVPPQHKTEELCALAIRHHPEFGKYCSNKN